MVAVIHLAVVLMSFTPARTSTLHTGDPVVAGASGKVTFVGWQNGYGQLVVIDHGGGLTTRYGHLSHIDVAQAQTVERGQFIGASAQPAAQPARISTTKFASTMSRSTPCSIC